MGFTNFLILSLYVTTNVLSQSTNSPTTTTSKPSNVPPFSEASVYCMIFIGIIGMILIPLFAGHTFYHFCKQELNQGISLILYGVYFSVNWMICFGYTFLKVDVIFPMGTSIDCKVGQYFIISFQLFSLISLIAVFVRRIDAAFYQSALAYKRRFLLFIVISYAIFRIFAYTFYVTVSYNAIDLVTLSSGIGICTMGPNIDLKKVQFGLAIGAFIEMIYLIIICIMFVYKLNKVVKMTTGASKAQESDNRLKKVMKKQTILVCFACISTIIWWGAGGVIPSMGILLHMDTILNSFCVWLMFKFSDNAWNKVVKICCCCCCCCSERDLLQTLHSLSISKVSVSSVATNPIPPNKTEIDTAPSHTNTIKQNISSPPTPVESNENVIEIKYNDAVVKVKEEEIISLSDHEDGYDNTQKKEHPTKSKSVELVEVDDESQSK